LNLGDSFRGIDILDDTLSHLLAYNTLSSKRLRRCLWSRPQRYDGRINEV
jgi:hypothetical protein